MQLRRDDVITFLFNTMRREGRNASGPAGSGAVGIDGFVKSVQLSVDHADSAPRREQRLISLDGLSEFYERFVGLSSGQQGIPEVAIRQWRVRSLFNHSAEMVGGFVVPPAFGQRFCEVGPDGG